MNIDRDFFARDRSGTTTGGAADVEIDFELIGGDHDADRRAVIGWREDLDTYYATVTDQEEVLLDVGATAGEITDVAVVLDALNPYVDSEALEVAAYLLAGTRAMDVHWASAGLDEELAEIDHGMDVLSSSPALGRHRAPLAGNFPGREDAVLIQRGDTEYRTVDHQYDADVLGVNEEHDEDREQSLASGSSAAPGDEQLPKEFFGDDVGIRSGLGY